MNKTKKILIILSVVFSSISIGLSIAEIVLYFLSNPIARVSLFYLIFNFIDIFALVTIDVLLVLSIWKNGQLFRARYGLYMTALVMSIIVNLLSVSSILLIASMFVSDWEWKKVDYVEPTIKGSQREKEEQIALLRLRHEKGELTDEQFQEELLKLL